MKINSSTETTFQAKRIMNIQRYYKSGNCPQSEVVDVFRLNKKDDLAFVKRCNEVMSSRLMRDLEPLQKQLKVFFKSFLDDFKTDSNDYYLAIKNREIILGGMVSVPVKDTLHITQAFSAYPKEYNLGSIFYAYLADSKSRYDDYMIQTNGKIKGLNSESKILPEEFSVTKRRISLLHKGTFYKPESDNIDIEEFLDIKDFEN